MTYLCDTHAFVRLQAASWERLGRAASRVAKRAAGCRDELLLSVVSLYEIALLIERGRLRAPGGWREWQARAQDCPGLRLLPLTIDHVGNAGDLRRLKDPFDRLIVGTAVQLGVPLLTADAEIAASGLVRVIWD